MMQSVFNKNRNDCFKFLFGHIMRGDELVKFSRDNVPRWMGHKVIKFPEDLILYQQVLFKNQPDILIEIGTKFGGSALFFANMFDLIGKGQVISIDVRDFPNKPTHPRITYLIGSSLSGDVVDAVREMAEGKKVMVSIDGKHLNKHVRKEMELYRPFVSEGQYLVVEDVYKYHGMQGLWPTVANFIVRHPEFKKTQVTDQFLIHTTNDGWLLKKNRRDNEILVQEMPSV